MTVSFDEQQFLILIKYDSFFFLMVCAFYFLRTLPTPRFQRSSPFSYTSFMFRSAIHLELIFLCGMRQESTFISFPCGYPVVPGRFDGKMSLSPQDCLDAFVKNRFGYMSVGLFCSFYLFVSSYIDTTFLNFHTFFIIS